MKKDKFIGFKCGRLRVTKQAGSNKHGQMRYECICDCGNQITVVGYSLKQGKTKSCGCSRRKKYIAGIPSTPVQKKPVEIQAPIVRKTIFRQIIKQACRFLTNIY